MSGQRHNFSSNSYPALLNFLKAVNSSSRQVENVSIWQELLPKNTKLLEDLQPYMNNDISNDIVDLTSSKAASEETPNSQKTDIHVEMHETQLNETEAESKSIQEYVSYVKNQLKMEDKCSEEVFINIKENLNNSQILDLFKMLSDCLENRSVHHLGFSIINGDFAERNYFATCYCKYLLTRQLMLCDEDTKRLLMEFANKIPEVVCPEIARYLASLTDDCPGVLQEYLGNLTKEHKQHIIREFILKCSKLEEAHLTIIDFLAVDRLEMGILRKFVDVLLVSSNKFRTSKSFGKLLMSVLKNLGKNVVHFEQEFRSILNNHNGPLSSRLLIQLQSSLEQTHNLSQTTLHY